MNESINQPIVCFIVLLSLWRNKRW